MANTESQQVQKLQQTPYSSILHRCSTVHRVKDIVGRILLAALISVYETARKHKFNYLLYSNSILLILL